MMNRQTTRVRATTNSGLDRYKQGEPKAGVSRSFVNNVRLQIQAKMRSKIRTEQLRGKLNKRALIRPVLPPVDGGKWNARIFSKREEHTKVNTAVTVLVDISGSMSGTKLALASQSVCLLANVFARAIKIPLEIIAFTYGLSSKVQMAVIKDFTRGTYSDSDMAARIAAAFSHGGKGNDDANALFLVVLAAVIVISGLVSLTRRDIGCNLVILWALVGIAVKHSSIPLVMVASLVSAVTVAAILIYSRIKPQAAIA